ncbi:hypothetical protein HPP92_014639 [Vanilla planifolia]|uniref:Uncharacterized protein n=1 Tax=Vanilla planifolia TaxID=51239 RepID=A0A835QS06_VANPL|nr:hypothetical protein HPP92_014639 [Vanilla planifolia]
MLRGNLKPVTVVLGWQDAVQDYIVHHKSRHPHQQKDPEFYQYLKEHDKELLEFNDEDKNSIGCIRSVLRAYRMACHHGDDVEDAVDRKFAILSSGVFNKIMVFVLNEMDGILRKLLNAPKCWRKQNRNGSNDY